MSDKSDLQEQKDQSIGSWDEIPVDELVRLTRELTERITNMDRQRLAKELKTTNATFKTNAPITLQQFFTGEIDLDSELSRRFANAPLMSEIRLNPKRPAKLLETRRAGALMSTQDNAAQMALDMDIRDGALVASFTLGSMLSFKFDIGVIEPNERRRWLELMRRQSGIAFLWSSERWQRDYVIWVVRENFARIYAFSGQYEAAARITPDATHALLDWLEAFWFPEYEMTIQSPKENEAYHIPGAQVAGDYLPGSIKDTSEIEVANTPLATIPAGRTTPTPPKAKDTIETPAVKPNEPEDGAEAGDLDPDLLDW